ncbi:ATP-dependent DNA helicase [Trichonephila clavipes]|uniref:ATP-dependent DNA helicase n=1 Tax=Trichonephila clavipes TaxID=2585209 RepID=A0A8X6RP64_TRICX|nr:ATP-dependent DNA helicase [Trichonephila clavipes]
MDIGNGRMEIDESTQCITLPANFCKITESIDELVQKVFPNIAQNYKNHQWLSTRAILAAKNIDVNTINFTIQHGIPSETTTYKSIDTVENQDEVVNYPTEFLNSLDLPGMPPHVLTLKIGVPIILLRNINPPRLCNGTRLSVKKMMNNVIEATILTGKFKVTGTLPQSQQQSNCCLISEPSLDITVKKFFELESLPDDSKEITKSEEEIYREEHFVSTYKRDKTGRFIVRLPIKENTETLLGYSKENAIKRLNGIRGKLNKNNTMGTLYKEFMNEYELLGHRGRLKNETLDKINYYIPHHSVYKPEKTSTRCK